MNALMVGENMQGLISIWQGLPASKRVMLIGAVAATVFAFSLLARTASSPSMALLYSGLEPGAAGEVVSALERMNVQMDVRGSSIYVPSNRRDYVRMALAQEGLPQQGQAGYELLENLNGFSTTSDIFDVTYMRAMEGELARTILTTPGVSAARVHIAYERSAAFSRNAPEPKGVVTVNMGRGALSPAQANAIRYLVSSSVPGLSAEQVAVLDSDRGVILSPGVMDTMQAGQAEAVDRERKMEEAVLNLLEARVGAGNARVQVALEVDTEREAISELVYDPNGRVISGKETRETVENTTGSTGGGVSVASNLPEGDAGGGGQSSTERTQTDEILSYDLSQVRREREKAPGAIKRLSVAVLVNHMQTNVGEEAPALEPRSDEELAALRELVAMAVGFQEARGDTLTIQNMSFQPVVNEGVAVERNLVGEFVDQNLMTMIQIAVLSIVTIILGLFVVKPVLSAKAEPAPGALEVAAAPAAEAPALTAEAPPDPLDALKGLANERTDETADLIKSWLEEGETAA